MYLYEVAVTAPLRNTLTYGPPEGVSEIIPVGMRVIVPLGNRLVTGYVLGMADDSSRNGEYQIKRIRDLPDKTPLFSSHQIPFFKWISDYYHHPPGEVIQTALPGGLNAGSGKRVVLTATGKERLCCGPMEEQDLHDLSLDPLIRQLTEKGEVSPSAVKRFRKDAQCRKALSGWEKKGWIAVEEILIKKKAGKEEAVLRLSERFRQMATALEGDAFEEQMVAAILKEYPALKKTEHKTLAIFLAAMRHQGHKQIPRTAITRDYAGAGKALHSLCEKNILILSHRSVYRDPFGEEPPFFEKPASLTPEQTKVLAVLLPAVANHKFHTFLLHGITGCGKTEVYLRATEQALALGKSVLVLVPEIALATQIEAHFYSRFGDSLAVLHSGLSTGQRYDQWQRILAGKVKVVIGARSAVFAPLAESGLVIVDEEHEAAYKQDDGLRYNGRDLAVLRAKIAGCPVILGSATPSVTSYHNALSGKYTLLTMTRRVHDVSLPEVRIIDLTKAPKRRPDFFLSDELVEALRKNLRENLQSLLFVNRRGYSGFMMCRQCSHIITCKHCQVSLTFHKSRNSLVCHYCGFSLRANIVCPQCLSGRLAGVGIGSERIEEEVRYIFPDARIARLDSDTTVSRNTYLHILRSVHDREIDILIGTQMIAKGLHFPHMTVVGVVWADSGLGIPDFRASERTYQLLSQVTGRAGRGEFAGKVLIQTHRPEHYAIVFARQHDYPGLYRQELALRQKLGYPPFSRLVNIRLLGENEEKVVQSAQRVAGCLSPAATGKGVTEILGPAPAPLAKIKDKSRWQVLVKSSNFGELHALCETVLQRSKELCATGVRLVVDIDPENMM